MQEFDKTLLIKSIQGECTPGEAEAVSVWLAESPENMETYTRLKMLWHARKMEAISSDDAFLAEINGRIDLIKKNEKRHRLFAFAKYAAVFAGLLAIGLTYLLLTHEKPVMLTHSTPVNGNVEIMMLSDGSKVCLNNGAVITYPEEFSSKQRIVELKGEAFFEVFTDASRPFRVKTDGITIEVTGTSFNLNTKPDENTIETVLLTGSVTLLDKSGNTIGHLKPGQLAVSNRYTGSTTISDVDTESYTSWQEGLVSFHEASLTEIIFKIEQVYHVDLAYDSVKISKLKKRYNFVFRKNQDVKKVLEMLHFIAPQSKEVKIVKK